MKAIIDDSRRRAALALLARKGPDLRRTARRFSLCADDAEDAMQRATLILLIKAPPHPPERLAAWMQVVTRREALALRRDRARLLAAEPPDMAAPSPGPAERALQVESLRERAAALRRLKPDERRALLLRAQGYSYAEICELTGWSYTKVNRLLSEGRARLRSMLVRD